MYSNLPITIFAFLLTLGLVVIVHELGHFLLNLDNDYEVRFIERTYHDELKESEKTVSEIFYETGFNNRSYFYRSFKEAFGVPPGDYGKGD